MQDNMTAVGIEFRMKGVGGRPQDEENAQAEVKESKAFKQLKLDCLQLEKEHEGQVFYNFDPEAIQ